jgi:hypothetical protein
MNYLSLPVTRVLTQSRARTEQGRPLGVVPFIYIALREQRQKKILLVAHAREPPFVTHSSGSVVVPSYLYFYKAATIT